MNKKQLQTILLSLIALPIAAHAQINNTSTDSFAYKTQTLNEITIHDNRLQIPFTQQNRDIVVLDTKVIQSLPIHSINELLSYVAGVDVRQRGQWGGQADISINGGTFDETLVLLNGIKIIDPQTGHNMMNLPINPEDIARVEILKGAAASAYGINALNGAINIVTKKPLKNSLSVNLNLGSSFQKDTSNNKLFGTLGLSVAASVAGKNSQHYLALGTQQSSGYRYNTALNNDKIYYQNNINLGKQNSLQFMGGFVYNDMGTNGFYAAPADKESKETIQTGIAAIKGNFKISNVWTMRPSLSYRYGFDDYIFVKQNPSLYENRHFTNVADAALNNTIKTAWGDLGLGIEYRKAAINSNSLGERSRENYGFFAEYGFDKIKDVTIHLGAYLNYNKTFGWQFLPSIDAGYQLNPHWRLFANVGTGTRLPTYTDWYYIGPENIGNSALMPENSVQSEAGLKYTQSNLNISANYFYRHTTDFIDWVKDSITAPWQPHNFQKIKMNGITFSADYRMLEAQTEKGLNLMMGLSYTWLHPTVVIPSGEGDFKYSHYALENLKNQAVIRLTAGFMKHFNATIAGRYQQRVTYKDYFLLDAKLEAKCNHFDITANLNNLGNVTYIETGAVPLPGRWFGLGIKWIL